MTEQVLTAVEAVVSADRGPEVVAAFEALVAQGLPPGLLRTELLNSPPNLWTIQSLWKDAAALEAMRSATEAPAAPTLFRTLGAEPTLTVHRVRASS